MWEKLCACAMMVFYTMTGPTIRIEPEPPVQGGTMKVHHSSGSGTEVQIDWHPVGGLVTAIIDDSGCVEVQVPDGATSVLVTGGGAQPETAIISAP